MTFECIEGRVYLNDAGGSYELKADEIDKLLAIYDRHRAVKLWLELDEAAQAAGYPGNVSSLREVGRAA
jgi:hypothetical protein